jgi:hypothetical protein
MNRHEQPDEQENGPDYRVDSSRNQPGKSRNNFQYRNTRAAKREAPTIYNGIHRRRQRRIMW